MTCLSTNQKSYIKFLPLELLPTFWTESERALLRGTSLAPAVAAKMKSLEREFASLRQQTASIPWCAEYWWDEDRGVLSLDDWKQVDAMYRSRALEFPGIGDSMVPCLDMANHASGELTAARYETSSDGDALLLLRHEVQLRQGDEVTITYGDDKGACEMIFSYGFLEDTMSDARDIFLDLAMAKDDPLGRAKHAVASCAPGVRLSNRSGRATWEGEYIWLICLNEEDGLQFRVVQTTDGDRQLEALFKDKPLEGTARLKEHLQGDPLWEVYQLRAVSIIQDRVEQQLKVLYSVADGGRDCDRAGDDQIRHRPHELAMRLRDLETRLLEQAYEDLENEVCLERLFTNITALTNLELESRTL